MLQKISCIQAYKIMYHFLDIIYFETYDEFLGDILSEATLYSEDLGHSPKTMDPAIFGEWMDGVRIVMNDSAITYNFTDLTVQQAYAAVHQYLIIYSNMGAEHSIKKLRDLVGTDIEQYDITNWLWNKWILSVEFVLQETPIKKTGHLFGEATGLTNHQSFKIMQIFLDIFCKNNNNEDIIQLLKNSRLKQRDNDCASVPDIIEFKIWNVWQNAIEIAVKQEENKRLNLLSAYKVMPIFLINYFGDYRSDFIDKTIEKFDIDRDGKPECFAYWRAWTSAAVKLNAKQTEIINNLISINTLISQDIIFEIIQTWLQYKTDIIGVDVVQQILADTQRMHQAIDEIKQQQRSYLLLDNEVTILETYQIMIKLLELHGKVIQEFSIDENGKPINFDILLDWIRICEQVIKA